MSYGDTVALVSASATVHAGEAVAITGASGSGKTTLLYCMAGLLRPQGGTVSFLDRVLDTMPESELSRLRRTSFGFVFQSAELVPEFTLRENVALPLEILGVHRKERRARVSELLDRLGLSDHADRRPSQVSGGQAQRAAVARALVHRPAVVFADEPTGALDSENTQIVLATLLALTKDHASALLLVTHDPDVASVADRVIHVTDGRTPAAVARVS